MLLRFARSSVLAGAGIPHGNSEFAVEADVHQAEAEKQAVEWSHALKQSRHDSQAATRL